MYCLLPFTVHSLIKAEGFALVCEQCSDQLSDVKRMHPLGTCADKTHIKVRKCKIVYIRTPWICLTWVKPHAVSWLRFDLVACVCEWDICSLITSLYDDVHITFVFAVPY